MRRQRGATAVELGLLMGLVALACIGAMTALGARLDDTINTATTTLRPGAPGDNPPAPLPPIVAPPPPDPTPQPRRVCDVPERLRSVSAAQTFVTIGPATATEAAAAACEAYAGAVDFCYYDSNLQNAYAAVGGAMTADSSFQSSWVGACRMEP